MINKKKAMTLIELLVVMATLSVLFILIIPKFGDVINNSRKAGVQTDMHSYEVSIKSFLMDYEDKEKKEKDLNKYLDKNLRFTKGYSEEKNPWGKPYKIIIDEYGENISVKTKDKNDKIYSLNFTIGETGDISVNYFGLETKQTCNVENPTDENYFTVTNIEDGVDIIGYSDEGPKRVEIPCQIGGKDVVKVSGSNDNSGAFESKSISHVVFPNTLKVIGTYSFYGDSLKTVWIPDSVTEIELGAFTYNNLTSVIIPDSVVTIRKSAFQSNKIKSVDLGEGITTMYSHVFYLNKINTKVTLPSSLKTIKENAFFGNEDLKEVVNKTKISNVTVKALFDSNPTVTN